MPGASQWQRLCFLKNCKEEEKEKEAAVKRYKEAGLRPPDDLVNDDEEQAERVKHLVELDRRGKYSGLDGDD